MSAEAKRPIRCAIYARKSSEEGLEQSFNSLDAQREACRAFIASQKHEGWRALSNLYDDGGFSGGTMDRPALGRLIEDVQAEKVDAVVVYKVDRLTRSLADFAKIIEIFDAHRVSFVSVTQQFNTTTSMGRLTLNVLLSFAQFEREVTGERIRDKIAASKRKGMWMGGHAPLGYDAKDRKLLVNAREAGAVREIYRQYLKLGCVSKLKIHLEHNGIRSKERLSSTGRKSGGAVYSRGALYSILRNRIYVGEIKHKGQVYPGEHEGIVPRELWERVQVRLQANDHAHKNRSRAAMPSLLVGLIYDDQGNRFTPAHAVKSGKRYRYYVSQAAIKNPGKSHPGPIRLPAGEIERLVCSKLRSFLDLPHQVLDALSPQENNAIDTKAVLASAKTWSELPAAEATAKTRQFVRTIVSRIVVYAATVEVLVDKQALQTALLGNSSHPGLVAASKCTDSISLKIDAHLSRCGREVRLVLPAGPAVETPAHPLASLIKAVVRAHNWHERILRGELTGTRSIAKATGLAERYVSRILQNAFLAPDIVESILHGRQPVNLTLEKLRPRDPLDWEAQRRWLGVPR